MKNLKFYDLMKILKEIQKNNSYNEDYETINEVIDTLLYKLEEYKKITTAAILKNKEIAQVSNESKYSLDEIITIEKEKKLYEKYENIINDLNENGLTKNTKIPVNRKIKKLVIGGALALGVIGSVMAFNGCRKTDKSKTTSVEATVEPEVIDEVPELTSEDFNVDPNNELSIIEKKAINYYNQYKDYYKFNADTKDLSEQDIINVAYLINDKENFLTKEDLLDAMYNIENGMGYESSPFMSIIATIDNKRKGNLVLFDNQQLNKQINHFKPARLSELLLTDNKNLLKIERAQAKLYKTIKEEKRFSKQNYNNMLVDIHYDNAYNNDKSISNDTENNSNLGLKYFMNAATYAAYDIGSIINLPKEEIVSTTKKDPVTGKPMSVFLMTNNQEEIDVLDRYANDEHSKELDHEYTKIRNKYPIFGYKYDMCYDKKQLEKLVKNNNKTLTLNNQ